MNMATNAFNFLMVLTLNMVNKTNTTLKVSQIKLVKEKMAFSKFHSGM